MRLIIYIGVFILLFIITRYIVLLFKQQKSLLRSLYLEGLRKENDGNFAAALEDYRKALLQAERFTTEKEMKKQLLKKIKLLESAIKNKLNYK